MKQASASTSVRATLPTCRSPSDAFDFLLCRAAFKNFGQPVRALQEMCRVLKPGGRGLIIDLRKDATMESINHEVDGMGLSAINKMLTKLAFRTVLLKSAYTKPQFQHMLAQANFRKRRHPRRRHRLRDLNDEVTALLTAAPRVQWSRQSADKRH